MAMFNNIHVRRGGDIPGIVVSVAREGRTLDVWFSYEDAATLSDEMSALIPGPEKPHEAYFDIRAPYSSRLDEVLKGS